MLSIFKSNPGGSLKGLDKDTYNNLVQCIEQALTLMNEPDEDLYENCALLVSTTIDNTKVLCEIVFYFRRMIASCQDPRKHIMILQLIHCLAQRCGLKFITLLDDQKFVNKLEYLAIKLNGDPHLLNRHEDSLSLDLLLEAIQRWSKALNDSNIRNSNLSYLYVNLLNRGYAPRPSTGLLRTRPDTTTTTTTTNTTALAARNVQIVEPIESLVVSVNMMRDLALAANSIEDVKNNENVLSVVNSIESYLPFLYDKIQSLDENEFYTINTEENSKRYSIGDLLRLSDEAERFLKLYHDFKLSRIDLPRLKQLASMQYDQKTGQYRNDGEDGGEGCSIM